MDESERNLYKKLQRRDNTAKKRQATFISEYVYVKYFNIYEEAARAFNQINTLHPRKPDLRTSLEFKNWKRQLKGQPKIRPHKERDRTNCIVYQDIPIEPMNNDNDVQCVHEDDNVPINIENIPKKTMQLKIPLFTLPANNRQVVDEGETVSDHQGSGETNIDQITEEVIDEGEITVSNGEAESNKDDLLGVEPSFFDDLSQETFDEMFSQLRSDPHLASIMNDFELNIGMNIEIDDRLERELQDM